MLFNSYEFIFIFLPVTMLVFYGLTYFRKVRASIWWIGFASLFFYAYWNWRFLFLFAISIVFNYFLGNTITDARSANRQKYYLILGLIANLSLLAYFKYTNFFLQNFSALTGVGLTLPEIILPVGISFFTFTQIAYIVDCARSKQSKYRFSDYVLFVSFFPHLVAGPILMHNATIPQIESKRFGRPSARKVSMAIQFFSIGLFKKIIIADNLALFVDPLFKNAHHLSLFDAWVAALLYTFQIYFDFSAYSEMAVGLALLMNVRIPFNFNSPYKALSIVDFWRRWHISLSSFLRHYLYIPLGGNRNGALRRYINLFITMLLGGLWHGASWTFVIWGGLHGSYLAINHFWKVTGLKLSSYLAWVITFFAVVIAWVFFRAQTLSAATSLLKSMIGYNHAYSWPSSLSVTPTMMIICISLFVCWAVAVPNTQQIVINRQPKMRIAIPIVLMLVLGILGLGKSDNFIYFQF